MDRQLKTGSGKVSRLSEFTASRQLPVFTVSGDGFRTDAFSGLEAEDAVASQMRI